MPRLGDLLPARVGLVPGCIGRPRSGRIPDAAHQGGSEGFEALVDALAAIYAYTYSVEPATVRTAAELRAEAMGVSDAWVERGCSTEDPELARERALLVRSYAALLAAVHR